MVDDRVLEAEKLYLEQGYSLTRIAEHFGISLKTANRWSVRGQWVAKKEGIESGKVKQMSQRIETVIVPDISAEKVSERLNAIQILSELVRDLQSAIKFNDDWKAKAGCATAIAKLLQLYLDITPTTAQQYARLAAKDGITPEEFINALREEWGKTA